MLRSFNFHSWFSCLNRCLHAPYTCLLECSNFTSWCYVSPALPKRLYHHSCRHFARPGAADFLFCFVSFYPLPQMVDLAVKKKQKKTKHSRWRGERGVGGRQGDKRRRRERQRTRWWGRERKRKWRLEEERGGFPSCLFFIRGFKSNERLRGRQEGDRSKR